MIRCKAGWRAAGTGLILWGMGWGNLGGEVARADEGIAWGVKVVIVLASEDGQSRFENEQIEGMRETIPPNVELRVDYLDNLTPEAVAPILAAARQSHLPTILTCAVWLNRFPLYSASIT